MSHRLPILASVAAIACAGALASFPAHAERVAWNVTIGGPGFAVSAGQPWGGFAPAPFVRPVVRPWPGVVAPAPVFVAAPVVHPVRWRHARPVVVAAPVVVRAPVVLRPTPVVVIRPF